MLFQRLMFKIMIWKIENESSQLSIHRPNQEDLFKIEPNIVNNRFVLIFIVRAPLALGLVIVCLFSSTANSGVKATLHGAGAGITRRNRIHRGRKGS